jgi:hypothetical protein
MTRSSSDPSRGGAKRRILVGIGSTAAVVGILAALLAVTPLADSGRGPATANAPNTAAPCRTTVHGFVVGRSTLSAGFIPAGFKLTSDPAESGALVVHLEKRQD